MPILPELVLGDVAASPAAIVTRRSLAAVAVLALFAVGAALSAIAGSALIVYVPYAAIGAILVVRREVDHARVSTELVAVVGVTLRLRRADVWLLGERA